MEGKIMPLADLLMERFKVKTRPVVNPKAITSASTTAKLILANNPNRLAWFVINLGAEVCYLGFENDVSTTKGVRLAASGGYASMAWDSDFDATAWSQWIIAASGTPAVYSMEIVER